MTAKKITVISPNFLIWKFYGKSQFPYSFWPKTMRKLCLSKKCLHQALREITVFFLVVDSIHVTLIVFEIFWRNILSQIKLFECLENGFRSVA